MIMLTPTRKTALLAGTRIKYRAERIFFQITDPVPAGDLHFPLQAEEKLDIRMGHIARR
jgi:hypothetical protein|nr:hypothetical protein [uncultured Schaedlerella sp.]